MVSKKNITLKQLLKDYRYCTGRSLKFGEDTEETPEKSEETPEKSKKQSNKKDWGLIGKRVLAGAIGLGAIAAGYHGAKRAGSAVAKSQEGQIIGGAASQRYNSEKERADARIKAAVARGDVAKQRVVDATSKKVADAVGGIQQTRANISVDISDASTRRANMLADKISGNPRTGFTNLGTGPGGFFQTTRSKQQQARQQQPMYQQQQQQARAKHTEALVSKDNNDIQRGQMTIDAIRKNNPLAVIPNDLRNSESEKQKEEYRKAMAKKLRTVSVLDRTSKII